MLNSMAASWWNYQTTALLAATIILAFDAPLEEIMVNNEFYKVVYGGCYYNIGVNSPGWLINKHF